MENMWLEFGRLAVGLLLMLFHRQIADFVLTQEHVFAGLLRARGVPVPIPPTQSMARNIYFGLGAFVCLFEMTRIWLAL